MSLQPCHRRPVSVSESRPSFIEGVFDNVSALSSGFSNVMTTPPFWASDIDLFVCLFKVILVGYREWRKISWDYNDKKMKSRANMSQKRTKNERKSAKSFRRKMWTKNESKTSSLPKQNMTRGSFVNSVTAECLKFKLWTIHFRALFDVGLYESLRVSVDE